jgi:hypothetical protein
MIAASPFVEVGWLIAPLSRATEPRFRWLRWSRRLAGAELHPAGRHVPELDADRARPCPVCCAYCVAERTISRSVRSPSAYGLRLALHDEAGCVAICCCNGIGHHHRWHAGIHDRCILRPPRLAASFIWRPCRLASSPTPAAPAPLTTCLARARLGCPAC